MMQRTMSPIVNPITGLRAIANYPRFLRDWLVYRRLPGAEPLKWHHAFPCLADSTKRLPFDAHYFYANGWAMRRIVEASPARHVDIASLLTFGSLLAAHIPVLFVEYRPVAQRLSGLTSVAADITRLPFPDRSLSSMSSIHVIEHIGLGRYGDRLNPMGTRIAAAELSRVLAPGGQLYVAVPIGARSVWFNAHRVFQSVDVRDMFGELNLKEFSVVTDTGDYFESVALGDFDDCQYGCGMFLFERPPMLPHS
jgi:SAM-dependent methyltransferase